MRVSALQLQNQDWAGTLAPCLGNLTFLREINLTRINLQGEIPREVGHLKRLQILDLRQNSLRGEIPMEMINCSSLKVIVLFSNNLTGKVPSWFGSMIQLTKLGLAANGLVGSIPSSFGNLSSLEKLSLAFNHLEGSITPALGNQFTGTFPSLISNLSELQHFEIAENDFHGPISPTIRSLHKLRIFNVAGNRFGSGRAHDLNFLSSLENCTQLQNLGINGNNLGGVLTDIIGNLSRNLVLLAMGSNQISRRIPEGIGKLINLALLESSNSKNPVHVEKASFHFGKNLGDETVNVTVPNLVESDLHAVHVDHAQHEDLEGWTQVIRKGKYKMGQKPSPSTHQVQPKAKKTPNKATSTWTRPNHQRTTHATGSKVKLSRGINIGKSLKNLVELGLAENKLFGNIPPVIGNLTMLSDVDLSSNKFEGFIPLTLGNCTMMERFYANDNNLGGNIPSQTFGYQQGLIMLSLHSNSFTGPIPSDFGNLNHLSILHLQGNKLTGEIPMGLSACSALTNLQLERNLFHGSIPSFLGSLLSLEVLDLSNNNFSSTIPHQLVNLTLLNTLNLSFNHLSGEVPVGGVFKNVSAISLAGNKDLCGGIPQLNLPACPMLQKHKRSLKKRVILIIGVGGVLISFVAFISIYHLKKKPKRLSTTSLALQYRYVKVSYGELHQATNGFSSSNLVGVGSFGSVYRGTLVHFERPIAVKVLNLQTHGASKSFTAECKALGKIKHRNLLNILTCCSSVDYKGDHFMAIVFEFMPNGSLETLLHNNHDRESKNLNLNLTQRVNIALDIAFALDYLHNDSEEAIVHCDVKPSNVLLDDDMVAHLGDFGLARLLHGHGGTNCSSRDQVSSSTIKGTIGYVPPEYGAGSPVSPQGDIYSYGILLLEMITGKKPTDSMFDEILSLHNFCKMAISEGITELVDSRLLIPIDEQGRVTKPQNLEENFSKECVASLFARIGVACSQEFPNQRMSIKDVITELHAIKQKLSCLQHFCDCHSCIIPCKTAHTHS
ncbi:hypothetical protein S245_023163, partial [Arachis hypogaea]